MASVFLLPSCCSFWFPVRETGGFFKGWPRFIAVRHSFCVPAGGTVDAQTVMLTASPVLCCAAWETALEYQWIFFLYQLSLSFYLPFSLSPSIFIQIFCSPLRYQVLVRRRSYFLLACLILWLSLCLAAFVAVWVEGCQQQQVWAVQSFVTPLRGRNIFYWCCPLLSLFVLHCLRPFGSCPLHNCCPCCSWPLLSYFS